MSKVGASLVRILREPIHIDQGYIINVYCMYSSRYLFDYAQYFITFLSVF